MRDDRPATLDDRPGHEALTPPPVRRDGRGRWIVCSPSAVAALLRSDDLVVVPPPLPPGRLRDVVGRMARFVEGPDHERARRIAVDALAAIDSEEARRASLDEMRRAVRAALDAGGAADLTALARRTTTGVLGRALGFAGLDHTEDRTVDALLTIASAIAPTDDQRPPPPAAIEQALDDLDAAAPATDAVTTANLIALLFQAVDATTGLVTGALCLPSSRDEVEPGGGRDRIATAIAQEPPVLSTRRTATRRWQLGGVDVATDDELVLSLVPDAAGECPADRPAVAPSTRPLAFGAGRHACPGWELALAMAAGMVDAVATAIGDGAHLRPAVRHERRANLRIVESLLLVDAPHRPAPVRPVAPRRSCSDHEHCEGCGESGAPSTRIDEEGPLGRAATRRTQ